MMKVAFASLLLLTAALGASAGAAQTQRLEIVVHGDGARATQLPQYDAAAPIVVSVRDSGGQHADAVSVAASGPQGESVVADLTRADDGSFGGTVTLGDPGAWQVRLTSRLGATQTQTLPVTLSVIAVPPSNAWLTGLAVGAGIFAVIGIGGFLLLRRLLETAEPEASGA